MINQCGWSIIFLQPLITPGSLEIPLFCSMQVVKGSSEIKEMPEAICWGWFLRSSRLPALLNSESHLHGQHFLIAEVLFEEYNWGPRGLPFSSLLASSPLG